MSEHYVEILNRFDQLSTIFSECELTDCACFSRFHETIQINSDRHEESSETSILRVVNMVPSVQEDTYFSDDNLIINESMRPSSAEIDNTALFTCSDIISDASYVSCSMSSSSGMSVVNNQSPAEQETSHNDRSLSSSSDQSFSVDTTQGSDNTFITTHDMSDDNVPYHTNSNYLLDLGLRCKCFRMGHINIQGINLLIKLIRFVCCLGLTKTIFMF